VLPVIPANAGGFIDERLVLSSHCCVVRLVFERKCVSSRFIQASRALINSILSRDDPFPERVVDQHAIEKCLFLFDG
jgi:hypothetical protein